MANRPSNDPLSRVSLTGNSGILSMSDTRPMLQPVRVKDLVIDDDEDESEYGPMISDNSEEESFMEDPIEQLQEYSPNETKDKENREFSLTNEFGCKVISDSVDDSRPQLEAHVSDTNSMFKHEKLSAGASIVESVVSKAIPKLSSEESSHKTDFSVNVKEGERRISDLSLNTKITQQTYMSYNRGSLSGKEPSDQFSLSKVSNTLKHKQTSESHLVQNKCHIFNGPEYGEKCLLSNKLVQNEHSGSLMVSQPHTISSGNHGVIDTPMKKVSIGTARPAPCLSQRNIFMTPQNKLGSDFSKNHSQTPATIFSHWSQNHMAQTPMQNSLQMPRESLNTPVSACMPVYNQRYHGTDGKGARRPLAETMHSSTYGGQLQKVQEVPNESRGSSEMLKNGHLAETHINSKLTQPSHPSSDTNKEHKENWIPNIGDASNQVPSSVRRCLPVTESKPCVIGLNTDIKLLENYHKDQQIPALAGSQKALSHGQVEKISKVQSSVSSDSLTMKPNRIITVKNVNYSILGQIGQGMCGQIFRVQDLKTFELRAIKYVDLSRMDKDSVQGCLEEISMLHRLQAPCIIHMFDYEIRSPHVFVVMEMGDTDLSRLLKSMLQDKKKLPLTMILYYWTEMLTAVKHIHDHGVIHSDLKPANFLLVRGRLKLIDFGIASSMNADMTSVVKDSTIGTLNYISPEALTDASTGNEDSPNRNVKYKISFKSDVWSLGCILYLLVYGCTPFQHIRAQWAKISAITDPKPNISFRQSDSVPPLLIDVMRKCLQHDPKARPTVDQLLQISYMQNNHTVSNTVTEIPSNIMYKIKKALTEVEWNQLTAILEKNRR